MRAIQNQIFHRVLFSAVSKRGVYLPLPNACRKVWRMSDNVVVLLDSQLAAFGVVESGSHALFLSVLLARLHVGVPE